MNHTSANPLYVDFLTWVKQNLPQYTLGQEQSFFAGKVFELQGPTGESNQYAVLPRKRTLSLAESEQEQIAQLIAIFSVGSQPVLLKGNDFYQKHAAVT